MVVSQKRDKPAFLQSVDLLLALHDLLERGQDDSPEADAIRDQMEQPWFAMTPEEQKLVRALSADLYTITDTPTQVDLLPNEIKEQLNAAVAEERWKVVLELVRQNRLEPPTAAFLRGISWSGLGLPAAAAEFFLQADRLTPGARETRLCALSTLIAGRRERIALEYALSWTENSSEPLLLLKAASAVFLNAVQSPAYTASSLHEQCISLSERAFRLAANQASFSLHQLALAKLQMAVSHALLGNSVKARELCNEARRIDPDNVTAMAVDGMLSQAAPPASQIARLAIARQIAGIPEPITGSESPIPLALQSEIISHVCSLN